MFFYVIDSVPYGDGIKQANISVSFTSSRSEFKKKVELDLNESLFFRAILKLAHNTQEWHTQTSEKFKDFKRLISKCLSYF